MATLVVLPTYQESQNIVTVLERIFKSLPDASVLVVDDGSPDGTADIAEEFDAGQGRVTTLRRPEKTGLGSAYREGFTWGMARGFDILVEMDADLSHDPQDLPTLVGLIGNDAQLVIGSRYVPGGSIPAWSTRRRLLSKAGNVYSSAMLNLHIADLTSGYRAYSAQLLHQLDLSAVRADSYGFQIEMAYRAVKSGAKVIETPIRFVDRVAGDSKMSTRTIVEALVLVTWWGLGERLGLRRRSR